MIANLSNTQVIRDNGTPTQEFTLLLLELQRLPQYTTTQLEDATSVINAKNKRESLQVWNTTTKRPLWAKGNSATDVWVDGTGATIHTPS